MIVRMSDATLWVLFIANAVVMAGLIAVVVRSATKVDYSRYVPPQVVVLPDEGPLDEIDLRDDIVVPAPRSALQELHMRQPHRVSSD